MRVTLIATVKNGADHIEGFLRSIRAQSRIPDEIVIVDGGSTDGTLDVLRAEPGIVLIEEPGANISRGRNLAIAAASNDVLAASDADCVLEPDWLQRLLGHMEQGADISMGFYLPMTNTFFERCMAAVNLPTAADEVDGATFMPSARSVAFTRAAIEAAGGYPEWLAIGEDMWVNHRWRQLAMDMRYSPDAVVHWRLRPDLIATWKQYFKYARGDAQAGMYPRRHALRFGVYAGAGIALASRFGLAKAAVLVGGVVYAREPLTRAWRVSDGPAERVLAMFVVPVLMAWTDTAKMAGYLAGSLRKTPRPPSTAS